MNYWHIECYRKNKVVQQIDWNGNYENLVKMLRNKMIIYSTNYIRNDTVVHYLNNYDYITINGDFYYELLKDEEVETIEEERFSKTDKIEKVEIEPLNIKNDLQRQIELVHYENIMLCDKINEIIERINEE